MGLLVSHLRLALKQGFWHLVILRRFCARLRQPHKYNLAARELLNMTSTSWASGRLHHTHSITRVTPLTGQMWSEQHIRAIMSCFAKGKSLSQGLSKWPRKVMWGQWSASFVLIRVTTKLKQFSKHVPNGRHTSQDRRDWTARLYQVESMVTFRLRQW